LERLMRCPECGYELTENERLLCSMADGHYCPQCWAKIPGGTKTPPGTEAKLPGSKRQKEKHQ